MRSLKFELKLVAALGRLEDHPERIRGGVRALLSSDGLCPGELKLPAHGEFSDALAVTRRPVRRTLSFTASARCGADTAHVISRLSASS